MAFPLKPDQGTFVFRLPTANALCMWLMQRAIEEGRDFLCTVSSRLHALHSSSTVYWMWFALRRWLPKHFSWGSLKFQKTVKFLKNPSYQKKLWVTIPYDEIWLIVELWHDDVKWWLQCCGYGSEFRSQSWRHDGYKGGDENWAFNLIDTAQQKHLELSRSSGAFPLFWTLACC